MKARILVVDDEPAIRDTMRMLLEYDGHEVLTAGSGQEGLTTAEREDTRSGLPRHQDAGTRRPRGAQPAARDERSACRS
jgi:CheY-like chemotaxis protein